MSWSVRLLFLLLVPLWLLGQDKYAGELFEFPGDAKSVAMGGAGVGATHEAATGFYNPALLGEPHEPSLMLAHREQFGGVVNADLVALGLRGSPHLAIHLGLVRRGIDGIPDTRQALDDRDRDGQLDDDERLVPDRIRYFNQREWGVLLSLARKDQEGWRWGVSAKLLGHWLAEDLGLGVGFDLGLWRAVTSHVSLGLMFQDITTTQVYWSTGRWATTAPRFTSGLHGEFNLPLVKRRVAVDAELTTRLDGRRLEHYFDIGPLSLLYRTGLELLVNENLRLRGGSGTLYPFTLGAGIRFPVFHIDYAYIGDTRASVFEPTHQVSITLFLESLRTFLEIE